MSGVLYLCNVLQFVIAVSIKALFLGKILSAILISEFFILFFDFSDKLYAIKEKAFKQSLIDISFVCTCFFL